MGNRKQKAYMRTTECLPNHSDDKFRKYKGEIGAQFTLH